MKNDILTVTRFSLYYESPTIRNGRHNGHVGEKEGALLISTCLL